MTQKRVKTISAPAFSGFQPNKQEPETNASQIGPRLRETLECYPNLVSHEEADLLNPN